MQNATTNAYNMTSAGLGSLATAFVLDSIRAMIPWLFVMFFIIVCDLVTGIARVYRTGSAVRFSKAVRDTLTKMTAYFFCCVAACMIDVATVEDGITLGRYTCLLICFIEGCSIMSNILKWHGYTLNFNKLVGVILKKRYDIEMMDSDGIIEKDRRSHARGRRASHV